MCYFPVCDIWCLFTVSLSCAFYQLDHILIGNKTYCHFTVFSGSIHSKMLLLCYRLGLIYILATSLPYQGEFGGMGQVIVNSKLLFSILWKSKMLPIYCVRSQIFTEHLSTVNWLSKCIPGRKSKGRGETKYTFPFLFPCKYY